MCPGVAFIAVAQGSGPTGDCAGAAAARGKPLPQIAAIGPNRRLHAADDHPLQHLARIGRELQLQQLMPHLFLRAAQKYHIAGKAAPARQNRRRKSRSSSMVASTAPPCRDNCRDRRAGRPRESVRSIVSCRRARRSASPLMAAIAQTRRAPRNRANFPSGLAWCCPAFRRGPHRLGAQAVSSCSTRWVAVVSSIRSTAANSRTKRSSAA